MRICAEDTAGIVIDFQDKLTPAINNYEAIVKNTALLVQGFQELGVPFTVTQQYTKGLGETVAEIKDVITDFKHIEKTTFSCCGTQEFVDWVKATGKKTLIVCGVEAHICVMQTVVDLLGDGYRVFIAVDCVGSRVETNKEMALDRMKAEGALLTSTEGALFEMTVGAGTPHFKAISKLLK